MALTQVQSQMIGGNSSSIPTTTSLGNGALNSNSAANNTAVGYQAYYSNQSGANNVAIGYQAGYTTTYSSANVMIGYQAAYSIAGAGQVTAVGNSALRSVTSGDLNSALGSSALYSTTTGGSNVAIGASALYSNTTASNNTAVGYQAGYSNTTGVQNTFIGHQSGYNTNSATGYNTFVGRTSGYNNTTGYQNTFLGGDAGYYVTTGNKNTILGMYTGNQGGVDIRTVDNNIVMSDGDGNPRLWYYYASSTVGQFRVRSHTTADSTNATFIVVNASGNDLTMEAGNASVPSISGVMRVSKYTSNNRSINAAGTVNQNGADYAEYMTKAGDFTIAKGDVVGIDANGKLTNIFADAISFCVKSTDPGLVGGDNWFTEPRPKDKNGDEVTSDTAEYQAWFARMEEARAKVDRIAFCGQLPVNVTGATAGQYIIPINDNGTIKGEAISNPTFEQYQIAVGKVIAIETDGRAKIIVKVA